MIMNMYAIFDRKAKSFSPPYIYQNDDLLKRSVADMFRDPQSAGTNLVVYAEDYDAYRIGAMDTDTGVIEGVTPFLVLNLSAFK